MSLFRKKGSWISSRRFISVAVSTVCGSIFILTCSSGFTTLLPTSVRWAVPPTATQMICGCIIFSFTHAEVRVEKASLWFQHHFCFDVCPCTCVHMWAWVQVWEEDNLRCTSSVHPCLSSCSRQGLLSFLVLYTRSLSFWGNSVSTFHFVETLRCLRCRFWWFTLKTPGLCSKCFTHRTQSQQRLRVPQQSLPNSQAAHGVN